MSAAGGVVPQLDVSCYTADVAYIVRLTSRLPTDSKPFTLEPHKTALHTHDRATRNRPAVAASTSKISCSSLYIRFMKYQPS